MQTLNNAENGQVKKEELTYAGFFARLLAYIIDVIIIGIGSFIVKYIVLNGFTEVELFSKPLLFSYSIVDIFTYLLKVSYFIICIYCTETTLGKYVMKLKVVRKDGGKLSAFNIIYRETIGRFVSSFLCVGYLLILIDKEKTALHDKLCDSRVIYGCNVKKTVFVRQQTVAPQYNTQFNRTANMLNQQSNAQFMRNMGTSPNYGNQGGVQPQGNAGTVQPQGNAGTVQPQSNAGAIQSQGNAGVVQPQGNTGTVQPAQINNSVVQNNNSNISANGSDM